MNEFQRHEGRDSTRPESTKRTSASREAEATSVPGLNRTTEAAEALRKRFLEAGETFYFRTAPGEKEKVAFTDQGRRLITEHDDPSVIHGMILRAQEKGWTAVRVKGTEEFKAEAWVQASMAGLDVEGYRPRALDLARRLDRTSQHPLHRATATHPVDRLVPQDGTATSPAPEPKDALSAGQRMAVATLETILRGRGDSATMITAAVEEAKARFQGERVVVGTVLEHGIDHYDHDPKKEKSYFVKVSTTNGERDIWGVDLARAYEQSEANVGDAVALVQQAHEPVTVQVPVRDESGASVGTASQPATRNRWDVVNLQSLGSGERENLVAAARVSTQEPVIHRFDQTAARTDLAPELTRTRAQERTREGR